MFHHRLRALRESAGISREHLADSLGITYSALSKYETGKREPDFDLLERMANHFEVSTDYLLGRTNIKYQFDPEHEYNDFDDFLKDPVLLDFLQTDLKDATPEEIEKLRAMYHIIKNS